MIDLLAADWNHWPDAVSRAEFVATAARLGVDGLELGIYDTAVELSPTRLDEWRDLGREHGVPVRMLLYSMPVERWRHGGLAAEVARLRFYEQFASLLDVAVDLGLEAVGLWPGADSPRADRDEVVVTLSEASRMAAARGVRVALEPKPGTVIAEPEDVVALASGVARPESIGVLLDTGHEFAAGRDPATMVAPLGEHLVHVHLGDSDGDPDADLPPGRLHDLDPFLEALDASGYGGAMSPDAYGAVASGVVTGAGALEETVQRIEEYRIRTR